MTVTAALRTPGRNGRHGATFHQHSLRELAGNDGWQRSGLVWSRERKAKSFDCHEGTGSTSAGSLAARSSVWTSPPRR